MPKTLAPYAPMQSGRRLIHCPLPVADDCTQLARTTGRCKLGVRDDSCVRSTRNLTCVLTLKSDSVQNESLHPTTTFHADRSHHQRRRPRCLQLTYRSKPPATVFHAAAVYLDDAGQPFGARFVHDKTGFTLDLIQVQSVPQAFTWVNTFPVSDKGEPHTQEHLLVGKGNVGRAFAATESMTLSNSSAFTMQWRTCYDFNTNAGLDIFYDSFRMQLNALLHPDYTDEEIGREVRNFGVSENPATHELRLEEKGTVYNEMVSSMAKPDWVLYSQQLLDVYGPGHPLSFSSGGLPVAIREMKPQDIRAFHDRHYFLANMGVVISLPKGDTVAQQLAHFDEILNAVQPNPVVLKSESEADLPAAKPAAPGSIKIVEFPYENDHQPSYVGLAWPANRKLSNRDSLLMEVFFISFAGDTTTNLYRLFVNSRTRKLDTGATGVSAFVSEDQGFPVFINLKK